MAKKRKVTEDVLGTCLLQDNKISVLFSMQAKIKKFKIIQPKNSTLSGRVNVGALLSHKLLTPKSGKVNKYNILKTEDDDILFFEHMNNWIF